jgi:hypothetical protein
VRPASSNSLFEIIRSRKPAANAAEEEFLCPFLRWVESQFTSSRRIVVDEGIVKNLHERFDGPGKAKAGLANIRGLTIDGKSLWLEYALPKEWSRDYGSHVDRVGVLVNEFDPKQAADVVYPKRPKEPLLVLTVTWNFVADAHSVNASGLSIYVDTARDGPAWHDYLDSAVQAEGPLISWLAEVYKKDENAIRTQFDRRIASRRNREVALRAESERRDLGLSGEEFGAQLEFTQRIELVPNILGMLMLEKLPATRAPEALLRMQEMSIKDVEPELPRVLAILGGLLNSQFASKRITPENESNRLRRLRKLPPLLSYERITL